MSIGAAIPGEVRRAIIEISNMRKTCQLDRHITEKQPAFYLKSMAQGMPMQPL